MTIIRTSDDDDLSVTNGGIEVRPATAGSGGAWNDYVERAAGGTVFHTRQCLATVADHLDATVHRLVGYKGREPVGVFPLFETHKGPATMAFSPPPSVGFSQMGPAMCNVAKLKPRRAEKRTRRFLDGCFEWMDRVVDPGYVHVRTHTGIRDPRPFVWNDFDLTPRWTYVLDLTPGADRVIEGFSGDARRNVRGTDDDAYRIVEGDGGRIPAIVDHLNRRHEEQGLTFPVTTGLVEALDRRLPDGAVRTYVCEVDGEYASGMVCLEDERTVYRWQGGARPMGDVDVPVNDLLDWRIITDAIDRGRERYDLVGANTRGVCDYKSKFAPDLVPYHAGERGTRTTSAIARLYKQLR